MSDFSVAFVPDVTQVKALGEFDLAVAAAGLCTCRRATAALAKVFGDDKLVPLSVGKRFSF